MSEDQLLNILIQLPIVGVFVWYSWAMNKQFREDTRANRLESQAFLHEVLLLERTARKEDSELQATQIALLTTQLQALTNEIIKHDKQASDGFSRLSVQKESGG